MTGGVVFAGRAVDGVPAGVTAAVGAEDAAALPAAEVAVATTLIECPTSSVTGRYDSAVAFGVVVQVAPAAAQRPPWDGKGNGFPPPPPPGTAGGRSPPPPPPRGGRAGAGGGRPG